MNEAKSLAVALIYTAPDGTTKLQVQLDDETVWLTRGSKGNAFCESKIYHK